MSNPLVCPSILAADFANIQQEVEMLNQSEADYIHIDIMDGQFVPNISFGFPVTEAIFQHTRKPLDFHLMIVNPDLYLEHCRKSGANIISVHFEACDHLHRTIGAIRGMGIEAGVAINPHTPVEVLQDILPDIQVVIVMSVNPGFGGQGFIDNTYNKVKRLRRLSEDLNPELKIEIDGGVSLGNAKRLTEAGADMLVAGSFVFGSDNPISTISSLKSL